MSCLEHAVNMRLGKITAFGAQRFHDRSFKTQDEKSGNRFSSRVGEQKYFKDIFITKLPGSGTNKSYG